MSKSAELYIYKFDEDIDLIGLYRITTDWEGELYENGKWKPYQGALSYYPDPSPERYVKEKEAREIMRKLDERDGIERSM